MKLSIGPGAIVAAAFIGPGTVTACTLAGANFGFALVWTLVFATLATIALQDMAARLGAGARLGLGEAIMQTAGAPWAKALAGGLVFAALAIGNAAYQAGNLAGGALGLDAVFSGAADQRVFVLLIAVFAGAALLHGRYKTLERVLIGLVLVMSLAFAIAAIATRPDLGALTSGLVPRIPESGALTAIALIGTTIVPYNLFLHAAAARQRWGDASGVPAARADTAISVGLGGLVSILIVATAASSLHLSDEGVSNAADMARALEPAFGVAAKYLVGVGLFAAGMTSAITAPMATGYALSELLPLKDERQKRQVFRMVALAVLVIGAATASFGLRPVLLILVAQAANGLLLPIVAVVLLYVMNQKQLLGEFANGLTANTAGLAVVVLTFGLGARGVLRAAGIWP